MKALGKRRRLIPDNCADLNAWPTIDVTWLGADEQASFAKRKRVVELYADGVSYEAIRSETGCYRGEVNRHVKRCVTPDRQGGILGFRALLYGLTVVPYQRRAPIRHQRGDGSGGCAGALGLLFERYPDVEDFVVGLFFKQDKDIVHEARISYRNLQKQFLMKLRSLGFTDNDWPFNTGNLGYKALRQYCLDLRQREGSRWVATRLGADASRRSSVGLPHRRLLPAMRPFSMVQLDYQKVDAGSIIVLKNEHGEELDVPVSRWFVGLMVEETRRLILGVYISLELNPSADCCLETVYSALFPAEFDADAPEVRFIPDRKLLPGHLIPALAGQCWSLLKMDNAWSNLANDALENLLSTVGCAINFGPVRAWWARPIVERIFKELTQRGLQRLPSTYGTGPSDTRVDEPAAQAIKFRILLSDLTAIICKCVRDFNDTPTEGLQYSSPISAVQAALDRPGSGLIPMPLPRTVSQEPLLLKHQEICHVRGNVKKHVRPYVQVDRCRYTSVGMATAPWLIGKKIRLYIDRRDARIAHAVDIESGAPLGPVVPEHRWGKVPITWRERKLLNSSGLFKRTSHLVADPVTEAGRQKKQQLRATRTTKKAKLRKSSAALDLARMQRIQTALRDGQPLSPTSLDTSTAMPPTPTGPQSERRDAFSLDSVPDITSARRKKP